MTESTNPHRYVEVGQSMGLAERDVEGLFATTARACENAAMRWQYLAFAKANNLDLLKGELHATTRNEKVGRGQSATWVKRLVLTISYTVFIQRCLDEGWVPRGAAAVCENDTWGGWDAIKNLPAEHITAAGDRGKVLGAWFSFTHRKLGTTYGMYYPIAGLQQTDKDGNPTRAWKNMGDHMAIKTVGERVARFLLPGKLGTVYGDEERGIAPIEEDTTPDPKNEPTDNAPSTEAGDAAETTAEETPPTESTETESGTAPNTDYLERRNDLSRRCETSVKALIGYGVDWKPLWQHHGAPMSNGVTEDNIDHFEAAVLDAEQAVKKHEASQPANNQAQPAGV